MATVTIYIGGKKKSDKEPAPQPKDANKQTRR